MSAAYLGKAMDAILEGQLPAGPAQPDLTYETDMTWGFNSTEADSVVVRAHYFLHYRSAYDVGQGRGRVTINFMEVNEGTYKKPSWKRIKLPDVMIEALEKEIEEEVGVAEDEDDEASEVVWDRGRAL